MTKRIRDIAHDVQRDNPHIGSKADVENVLKSAFSVILERVANGDVVIVQGFGTFQAKVHKGRTLNSPLMKGGSIKFGDQLVLRFRQAASAKAVINQIDKAKAKSNGKASAKKAKKAKAKKVMSKAKTAEANATRAAKKAAKAAAAKAETAAEV